MRSKKANTTWCLERQDSSGSAFSWEKPSGGGTWGGLNLSESSGARIEPKMRWARYGAALEERSSKAELEGWHERDGEPVLGVHGKHVGAAS